MIQTIEYYRSMAYEKQVAALRFFTPSFPPISDEDSMAVSSVA